MPPKQYVIKEISTYKVFARKENRSKIDEVIGLYKAQKIPNQNTAKKIAFKLEGNNKNQIESGVSLLEA